MFVAMRKWTRCCSKRDGRSFACGSTTTQWPLPIESRTTFAFARRTCSCNIVAWPRQSARTLWQAASVAKVISVEKWLRAQCSEYGWGLGGVFRSKGEHDWPLIATDEADLEAKLNEGGHILPLPEEPAALANVLEVGIVSFLMNRVDQLDGATATRGTIRGYPDLELDGPVFGGGFHAVDVKIAKRAMSRRGVPLDRTQSRITLYTGNTYFRHPEHAFPGVMRPFGEYASHLDVLGIYTFTESKPGRVDDLELIVQPPWKIASNDRSSTTREYIGAVKKIADLRDGNGDFATEEEFYTYWRRYRFKIARAAEQVLAKQAAKK
jgi:hypothetical protein